MQRVMEEYGTSGKVAWVYRHFPLDSLHPKARQSAEAAECAAELGGEQSFWAYVDRYYIVTPSNNGINLDELPNIAAAVGLDRAEFEACLAGDAHEARVEQQVGEAVSAGGRGTPYSIVIGKNGNYPINGALPYEQVKAIIDKALQ